MSLVDLGHPLLTGSGLREGVVACRDVEGEGAGASRAVATRVTALSLRSGDCRGWSVNWVC